MYTQYTKVSLRFRSETYQFIMKYNFPPDISEDEIVSIVNQKFETVIGASEISYIKINVSEDEYESTNLDRYSYVPEKSYHYSVRTDSLGPTHPFHHCV